MRGKALLLGLGGLCLAASSFAQVQLSASPVWNGIPSGPQVPLYVNIRNLGADDAGTLQFNDYSGTSAVNYPLELPRGSSKRVLVNQNQYGQGSIVFESRRTSKKLDIRNTQYDSGGTRFGLISDNPADLAFVGGLETEKPDTNGMRNGGQYAAGGSSPEDAPDRYLGYEFLAALVLSDGSERLRDSQISAIRNYVCDGGVLVFVGGAGRSALDDPRWKDFLPLRNLRLGTNRSGVAETTGTTTTDCVVTETSLSKLYSRSYGLGIVAVLPVNPFEAPLNRSENRRSAMMKVLNSNLHTTVTTFGWNFTGDSSSSESYGAPAAAYPSSSPYSTTYNSSTRYRSGGTSYDTEQDPFQIKPPDADHLFWILLGYVVVVLPINFLILKKMKRLEFAWVTTPIISVIFSGLLLSNTIGLYSSSSTTKTTAVVLVPGSGGEGMAFARSEMFFPAAKAYDLQLKGVESLNIAGYGDESARSLSFIDNGQEVVAPEVTTGNLAFKEFRYHQKTDALAKLTVTRKSIGDSVEVTVTNGTKGNISQVYAVTMANRILIAEMLAPGASKSIKITNKEIARQPVQNPSGNPPGSPGYAPDYEGSSPRLARLSPGKMIVEGAVQGLRIGPGYGRQHPSSWTTFLTTPVGLETVR